jgi:hypothetical protein
MLDLDKAREELSQKNMDQIQKDTAYTWASRAIICYENCLSANGVSQLAWWSLAEEYANESKEHSALVSNEDVLSQIKKEIEPYQEKAAQFIDKVFRGSNANP